MLRKPTKYQRERAVNFLRSEVKQLKANAATHRLRAEQSKDHQEFFIKLAKMSENKALDLQRVADWFVETFSHDT